MNIPPFSSGEANLDRERYQRYIAENPRDPMGYMMLGSSHHEGKDYDAAIEAYEKAIGIAKEVAMAALFDQAKAWEAMGLAYQGKANREGMIRSWIKAKEVLESIPALRDAIQSNELYQEIVSAIEKGEHPRLRIS